MAKRPVSRHDQPSEPAKILAEFSALRKEIEYRSYIQIALVTLNVTAVAPFVHLHYQTPPLRTF
jgi:hypothetical protein